MKKPIFAFLFVAFAVTVAAVVVPVPANAYQMCCCQFCFEGGPCLLLHCGTCPQMCANSTPDVLGMPGLSTLWTAEATKNLSVPLLPKQEGLYSKCGETKSVDWNKVAEMVKENQEIEKPGTILVNPR